MGYLFIDYSINEITTGIETKHIKPEEVYQECVDLTKKYSKYQVWTSFSGDLLEESYKNMTVKYFDHRKNLLPLLYIPIGVKDVINTIEYPTQMGSSIWKGYEAGNDARIVYNIKRNGGIVAGKTVTAEFAVHALNETLNPYDIARTPGTSSSGSAVAVALGIVPAALATQTAGSIIRPSSFCGVFGYKPSFGLIPRTGVLKTTDSLDTMGFVTSRVENLRVMLNVMMVKGPDYPFVYKAFRDQSRQKKGNRKWRVGFVKTYTWNNTEEYVKKSLIQFVHELGKDPEIDIEEINIDNLVEGAHEVHRIIYNKSLSYYFANEHHDVEKISVTMNSMIEDGERIEKEDFIHALQRQDEMCVKVDEFMVQYDALISVSTASVAPLRDVKEKDDPSLIWTLLHLPTVNVPRFYNEECKLPYGVQIISRRFNDGLLLEFIEYLAFKGYIPEKIVNPETYA